MMKIKSPLAVLFSFLVTGVAFAEEAFETTVTFMTPSIVRITRAKSGEKLVKPWRVVLAQPEVVAVEKSTTTEGEVWKSSAMSVLRTKSGFFLFRDAAGNELFRENGSSFEVAENGTVSQGFKFLDGDPLYGLGDLQKPYLNHRHRYVDFGHQIMPQNQGDGIAYVCSPRGWGLFWDDSSPVNVFESAGALGYGPFVFKSFGAKFVDYYVIAGGTLDGCVAAMRHLTGPSPMLPIWTYGFWQSRERYKTQDELLSVLKRYRQDRIPLDGIVQDWQYWGSNLLWNDMKFDSRTFPDPKGMVDEIHRLHAKTIITIWPSFGPQTDCFKELKSKNLLIPVKTWPLWVSDDDHTLSGAHIQDPYVPEANEIYWMHLTRLVDLGFDGWWMDSTDPDHFSEEGDLEIKTATGRPWRELRSVYPLACTEAVATRLRERDNRRPFILTRGASAGQQRCSASVWSGDVDSSWDALSYQIPAGLNYSLTGNPQFNCDLGGFFAGSWEPKGGVECPEWRELYVRWFELGVYLPMMRSHGTGLPREIYLYGKPGEPVYDALYTAIKRRYSLLPYIYSTASDVSRRGTSFMRPLAADFAADKKTWNIGQEFLFGKNLLVAPVTTPGNRVPIYLPTGSDWWNVDTEKLYRGGYSERHEAKLHETPCFAKAGTILPIGPDVQWIGEKPWDDLEVRVYPGADGTFTLYEDDGETRDCEKGAFTEIDFAWNDAKKTLTIGPRRGSYPGMLKTRSFRVRLVGGETRTVQYAGGGVEIEFPTDYFAPKTVVLDKGWEFSAGGTGEWTRVSVPHDAAIKGPFDFNADPHNKGNGNTGALPWFGKATYRRSLLLPKEWEGKARVALEFDGVMSRPEVFLDGKKIGGWNYGYLGFRVELANVAKFGVKHELIVTCDTTRQVSRWYPGLGIYREVRLVADDADRRAMPGSVTITPVSISADVAVMKLAWETPIGPDERVFRVENPRFWDVDDPYLYTVELFGRTYTYGIREIKWNSDGFYLNGRRLQLKGVDLHSDLGPLGMAFDKSAARRQLEIMKDMGVNAIRTSHNPPDPKFLDLCDEMGFVVWDECFDKWDATSGRTPDENLEGYVLGNLVQFVRRDRNHPSIVVWSLGNEISPAWKSNWYGASCDDGTTRDRVKLFADAVRALDPTRPVAMGCCFTDGVGLGHLDSLDLTGWNYRADYRCYHERLPGRPTLYSEASAMVSTFGCFDPELPLRRTEFGPTGDVSSYDLCAPDWSDIPDVEFDRERTDAYLAGQFIWSGTDYLGEPFVKWERNRSSLFGICDLTHLPKDRFYLYRSLWNTKSETVHIVPHWTWPGREGQNIPVFCYASGDRAELFVNGKSMGVRTKGTCQQGGYYAVTDDYRFRWLDVPYEPGEISVIAWRDGKKIGEAHVRTAGAPAALKLELERRDESPESLRFVQVSVTDAKGVTVPDAANRVKYAVEGGEIVAIGNGSNSSTEPFQGTDEQALFHSRAVVYVRVTPGARCVLTATTKGLPPAKVLVSAGTVNELAGNPITPESAFFSDPAPRVGPDGKLWLFGSRDVSTNEYCSHSSDAFETTDLLTWRVHRDLARSKGEHRNVPFQDWPLLAPDGIYLNGAWHLFYCLFDTAHAEGVLDAPSAEGPYSGARELKGPTQIDPSVFQDDDGTVYYTWGQFAMNMGVLKPDLSGLVEGSVKSGVIDEARHHFHEGSQLTKRGDTYYLTFADIGRKGTPSCIGYATASAPFGPYVYRGVIVDNAGCDPANWNNHGGIVEYQGRWYVFYHRATNGSRHLRKACVEPIEFDANGFIKEVEMTSNGAGPELDLFVETPSRRACLMSGNARIVTEPCGAEHLAEIRPGDTAAWRYFRGAREPGKLVLKVRPDAGGTITLKDGKDAAYGSVKVPAGNGRGEVEVEMALTRPFPSAHVAVALAFDGAEGSSFGALESFRFL